MVSHKLLGFHALQAGMFLLPRKSLQVPQTSVALPRRGAAAEAGGGRGGGTPRAFLSCIFPLLARGTFVNPRRAFSRGLGGWEEGRASHGLPVGMRFPLSLSPLFAGLVSSVPVPVRIAGRSKGDADGRVPRAGGFHWAGRTGGTGTRGYSFIHRCKRARWAGI